MIFPQQKMWRIKKIKKNREDSRTSNEDVDDHDGDGGRWLRTRNQVDYREANQNDSFDLEISDIFIGRFRC